MIEFILKAKYSIFCFKFIILYDFLCLGVNFLLFEQIFNFGSFGFIGVVDFSELLQSLLRQLQSFLDHFRPRGKLLFFSIVLILILLITLFSWLTLLIYKRLNILILTGSLDFLHVNFQNRRTLTFPVLA